MSLLGREASGHELERPSDTLRYHGQWRAGFAMFLSRAAYGGRPAMRVGPFAAEVTGASLARLGSSEGDEVLATFKATGTRLLPVSAAVGS